MTTDGDPIEEQSEQEVSDDFESVDRFLDVQRRLLDDRFDVDDELLTFGGAALEDEPDELDP